MGRGHPQSGRNNVALIYNVLPFPAERFARSTRCGRAKASFTPRLSLVLMPLLCLGTISASAAARATDAGQLSATLPNGRRITPAGNWIKVAPFPYTLAARPGRRRSCCDFPAAWARELANSNRLDALVPIGTRHSAVKTEHRGSGLLYSLIAILTLTRLVRTTRI